MKTMVFSSENEIETTWVCPACGKYNKQPRSMGYDDAPECDCDEVCRDKNHKHYIMTEVCPECKECGKKVYL